MGAFVVSKQHIDALIAGGLYGPNDAEGWTYGPFAWYCGQEKHTLTSLTADEVGDLLVRECVRSVSYRYDDSESLPGPNDAYYLQPYRFSTEARARRGSCAWLAKLVHCYEYQSCEHPEWDESCAHAFCSAVKGTILRSLPGYDAAPWGL